MQGKKLICTKTLFNSTSKRFFSQIVNPSYVHGTSDKPLLYLTIGQLLNRTTHRYPSNLAVYVHHQNISKTYAELNEDVQKVAAAFASLNLLPKDRIGIYSPNNYEWLVTQLAAATADLILVNINPAYRSEELKYTLNKVKCKALVMAASHKKSNYIEILGNVAPEIFKENQKRNKLKLKEIPSLKWLISLDKEPRPAFYNFEDLYEMHDSSDILEIEKRSHKVDPDDATNIQFTSGTTGFPKGATLSHMNIVNNSFFVGSTLNYTSEDKVCIPVPLYHCFGMVMGNLAAINHGATMVYPSEGFDPVKALEAVSKIKATSLYGVPTMFIEMLKEYEKNKEAYDVSQLRTGIMAGTLCPRKVMENVINIFGMKQITICYGMTETSPVSFQTHMDDPIEKRVSTVGRIHPHVEVKIIDKDGLTVPRETPGEICTRAYSVMKKYWADPKNTQKTFDEQGWLRTGDVGVIDEEGYLSVVGRIKDMIIRGGENIYPKEIEEFLMKMENVQKVEVIGVHDEKYGEEVMALIMLKDASKPFDKTKIKEFCEGKIAHYKIPRYVKFVTEFPITITGKPKKNVMRDEAHAELKEKKYVDLYSLK